MGHGTVWSTPHRLSRLIASGEAARQVAAADEVGQLGRQRGRQHRAAELHAGSGTHLGGDVGPDGEVRLFGVGRVAHGDARLQDVGDGRQSPRTCRVLVAAGDDGRG
ncbi:hypothetical protein [Mycolicibacterium litorale]|uniref:hypothetical protein n=1 Tax=Mycolicibacterium litorale TaxID=758802 RepID=UPI001628BCA6